MPIHRAISVHNQLVQATSAPRTIDKIPIQTIGFIFESPPLDISSALKEIDYKDEDGQNTQDVDETTQGVGSDQSQQPQDKQNRENCPKHGSPLWQSIRASLSCVPATSMAAS